MNLPELTETAKLVLEQYDATRFRWEYRNGRALFSAFFAYELEPGLLDQPYMPLLVSYRPTQLEDTQHWSHLYEVHQDRQGMLYTNPMLSHEEYKTLIEVLRIQPAPTGNPFRVSGFLQELQQASHTVPGHWNRHRIRAIQDIPSSLRNDVEEPDAVYFCGWHQNPVGKYPTARNLEKTRRFLGPAVADECRRLRVSSRWTTDQKLAKPLPCQQSVVEAYTRQTFQNP